MEEGFLVDWRDIVREAYRDPLTLSLGVVFPLAVLSWILLRAYMRDNIAVLFHRAEYIVITVLMLFVMLLPIIYVWFTSRPCKGYYGYRVRGDVLEICIFKRHEIPLGEAALELRDYNEVKPLPTSHGFRLFGIFLSSVKIGRAIVPGLGWIHVFIYHPGSKALVIEYKGEKIVVSHPGIERLYKSLAKARPPKVQGS